MLIILTPILVVFICYSLLQLLRRKMVKPDFTGKTVWITGASSGIGEYLAYEFATLNAQLILSARGVSELERVRSKCKNPLQVKVVQLDMADDFQIQKVTAQVIEELEQDGKKLDIIVENAGISMRCLLEDYCFENHLTMQQVNLHGPFRHIQCLVGHFIKNKGGHIVGITSVAGKLSTSHRSSYSGSKCAFIGLLDSLRTELHQFGVSVTNIMPGYVHTNLSKNALVAKDGEKLGFTDKNIAGGLSATTFAAASVRAIYNKENEVQISGKIFIPVLIWLRNLCPDLIFLFLRFNGKSQAEAIAPK